jgi:hypothetical protein
MKTFIALDEIAKKSIPKGEHPMLRVNSREAWVKLVIDLIATNKVELTASNIKKLSQCWEALLYNHYSALN